MQLARTTRAAPAAAPAARRAGALAPLPRAQRGAVVAKANLFLEIFASGAAGAAATAVTLLTAEDTDKEIERIKTVEGALVRGWRREREDEGGGEEGRGGQGKGGGTPRTSRKRTATPARRPRAASGPATLTNPPSAQTNTKTQPIAAAVGVDAIAHSIPGLSVLLALLSEPAGAAAGVAYMMSLVLSSPAVDPATLAPKGTILNAEKADDSRGRVRVPFTRIVSTALEVTDFENEGSSGAGWTIGKNGLPKLPLTSVLAVVGVGAVILEAASHAPVFNIFMPRVLQVAGWLAAAGYLLDKRQTN